MPIAFLAACANVAAGMFSELGSGSLHRRTRGSAWNRMIVGAVASLVLTAMQAGQSANAYSAACGLGIRWEVSESGWAGVWIRRSDSNTFDATWRKGGETGHSILTITLSGNRVAIQRQDAASFGGVRYVYEGTLGSDGSFSGINSGQYPVNGKVICGETTRPAPPAPPPSPGPASTGQAPGAYSAACGLGVRWEVSESGWGGVWIRRGNSNTFDAIWRKGGETGHSTLTITLSGNRVAIQRQDAASFGGVRYVYEGTLGPDGSFSGINSGQYPVNGKVICGAIGSPVPSDTPASPVPASGSVHFQVENLVFNAPDNYQNPRNLHDFIVDWSTCQIRNLSQEAERGIISIKVLVCRPNSRLTFQLTNTRTGGTVDYDWALRDSGQAVYGAWRQGSGFGPSVGGVRR